MVFSKRASAFLASPASSSFFPSSVSLSEAARCGEVPGVILASSELSSGKGGGAASGTGGVSPNLLSLDGSFTAGGGVLGVKSCSLIFES
jgi:hypothetical protein